VFHVVSLWKAPPFRKVSFTLGAPPTDAGDVEAWVGTQIPPEAPTPPPPLPVAPPPLPSCSPSEASNNQADYQFCPDVRCALGWSFATGLPLGVCTWHGVAVVTDCEQCARVFPEGVDLR
jgi:hypothetical protein